MHPLRSPQALKIQALRIQALKIAVLGIVALAVAGCGDDPVTPPAEGTFAVTAVDADTGEPVPDLEIVLVDALSALPLDDPRTTDADGRIVWPGAAVPGTRLLVFGGGRWGIAHQGDWWLGFGYDKTDPRLPIPPAEVRVELVRLAAGDGLPRLSGRITDAVTGEPLSRVFVGDRPWLTAYGGATGPSADVTGPDGLFAVGEVPVAIDPVTQRFTHLSPLVITRAGYRPLAYLHEFAPGAEDLDVTGIAITLTPLGPDDDGVLTGHVFDGTGPAPHVLVGLGGVDPDKTGYGIPGRVAVTDREGRFTFTELAPGNYVVQPGFLYQDGFFLPPQPAARGYAVTSGDTTLVDDLLVLAEIVIPTDPSLGIPDFADVADFGWWPVAGDPEYVLTVDGVEIARTTGTSYTWEFPADLPAGRHGLRITALVGERVAGRTERPWTFRRIP